MVLHRVPDKQLGTEVMIEGEDASLLGAGASTLGQIPVSDGATALAFGDLQDGSSGSATSGQVLTAQGGGTSAFTTLATANLFSATIPTDFADVQSALAAFEAGSAKTAILYIEGAQSWGAAPLTSTKPVRFIGSDESAKITMGAGLPTFDFPGVDEIPIEFFNLLLDKPVAAVGIDFAQSAYITFKDCVVSNPSGETAGFFRTLVGATTGKMTVIADKTSFTCDGTAGISRMFKTNKAGTGEVVLKWNFCDYFNSTDEAFAARLVETSASNIQCILENHSLIHHGGFIGNNLKIHYDGTSLVTDDTEGATLSANVVSSETLIGEAGYDTGMDAGAITVDSAIAEVLADALLIAPGTYPYTLAAIVQRSDFHLKGSGQGSTILDFNPPGSARAIDFASGADRCTLSDFTIDDDTPGTTLEGIRANNPDTIIRDITWIQSAGARRFAIGTGGDRNRVSRVDVKRTGTGQINDAAISAGGSVEGIIEDCTVDLTDGVVTATFPFGIEASRERYIIRNNKVRGAFNVGIRANADRILVSGNMVDQQGITFDAAHRGIELRGDEDHAVGNYVFNVAGVGISILGGTSRCHVVGNHIVGGLAGGTIGILIDPLGARISTIEGNKMSQNTGAGAIDQLSIGIKISGAATGNGAGPGQVVHALMIKNNTIDNMRSTGIFLETGPAIAGAPAYGPTIRGNDIIFRRDPNTPDISGVIGIDAEGDIVPATAQTIGLIIQDNRVDLGDPAATPGNGIIIRNFTEALIEGNHVKSVFAATTNGIELVNVDESTISNNQIKGFLGAGGTAIVEPGTCDQNLYSGNHVRGNTTGLSFAGTNRLSVGNKT